MTVDEIVQNPYLLAGKTPEEVEAVLEPALDWRIERLGHGDHAGQGWLLRQYNERGNLTGRLIQWHPGGGHHGPDPYWKVRSSEHGISDEIRWPTN